MEIEKQLLIEGVALAKLGNNRIPRTTTYLINDPTQQLAFLHNKEKNIDYYNANGNPFFAELWKKEERNIGELATPQTLLELRAYFFVQYCRNKFFQQADGAEYDIKFLVRQYNLAGVKVLSKYIAPDELVEIESIIKSVKR